MTARSPIEPLPFQCHKTDALNGLRITTETPMTLSLSLKNLLPLLAIVLGIAAIVAPRFLNVYVAVFLIVFGIVGLGFLR